MKTTQLKALLKKSGLTISKEIAVSFTRAARRTTQGIAFEWTDVPGGHRCVAQDTPTHHVNETDQELHLVSKAREGVLSGPSDYATKQAQEDAAKLADVLKGAGVPFQRVGKDGLAFRLPDFKRVLLEGWGKRTEGRHSARYRNFKRVEYPESVGA